MEPGEGVVTWAEALTAIGAVITPLIVLSVGYALNRHLKRIEAKEWRGQELIAARLGYFREIVEPMNDLLCYFTFVGRWKEWSPLEIIEAKRELDRTFHVLAPLFGVVVSRSYSAFMDLCFEPYGEWGADARLRTGYRRRVDAYPGTWDESWAGRFTHDSNTAVSPTEIDAVRAAYNEFVARLVAEVRLVDPRPSYASAQAVLNA